MSDYIFGIKCNGISIQISQISIDEDQSKFDYICNVSLKDSYNGNGSYDVSIVNKEYIQGMVIGKWRITKAWISYDWGASVAKLIMEDEDGNETCELIAGVQKGSVSGYHIPSLTETIFTKAREIMRDYPNAKIYNALTELNNSKEHFDLLGYISRYKEVLNKPDKEYIDFIELVSENISKHIKVFKMTMELLKDYDDQRSKNILRDITSDCRNLLECFKICDSQ